jgi:hypothetical protein
MSIRAILERCTTILALSARDHFSVHASPYRTLPRLTEERPRQEGVRRPLARVESMNAPARRRTMIAKPMSTPTPSSQTSATSPQPAAPPSRTLGWEMTEILALGFVFGLGGLLFVNFPGPESCWMVPAILVMCVSLVGVAYWIYDNLLALAEARWPRARVIPTPAGASCYNISRTVRGTHEQKQTFHRYAVEPVRPIARPVVRICGRRIGVDGGCRIGCWRIFIPLVRHRGIWLRGRVRDHRGSNIGGRVLAL